jgi:hypothetical protein
VIQKPPRSFSSSVEWPRRYRLRSGAASRSARVSGSTGVGVLGTVSFGLLNRKSQVRRKVLPKPIAGRGSGFLKRPSPSCGEAV